MNKELNKIMFKYNEAIEKANAETDEAKKAEAKKKAVEDTNAALKEMGVGVYIDLDKNVITDSEKAETTISGDLNTVNGYGMLDTGTGTMDKVKVENNVLVNGGVGDMPAFLIVGGLMWKVEDDKVTDFVGMPG